MIAPDDRGFTLGDGLFETLLAEAGELRDAEAHLERMTAGCAVLGLPVPDHGEALRLMRRTLADAGLDAGRAAVRLTLTAGGGGRGLDRPDPVTPRMVATAAAAPRPTGPLRLAISRVRRNAESPASRLKTLAYLDNVLARREARAAGADEAVMLNTRGEVACAAAGNLFWSDGEALWTPPPEAGVLAGIARARLIAAAGRLGIPVRQAATGEAALRQTQAVIVTNSLIGARPAASLDGRELPGDRLSAAVIAAF